MLTSVFQNGRGSLGILGGKYYRLCLLLQGPGGDVTITLPDGAFSFLSLTREI